MLHELIQDARLPSFDPQVGPYTLQEQCNHPSCPNELVRPFPGCPPRRLIRNDSFELVLNRF